MITRTIVSICSACLVIGLAGCDRGTAPELPEKPRQQILADLQSDVQYLASDELEGRLAAEPGITAAEDYIAAAFEEAGLLPIPGLDGFFQDFTITRTGFDLERISLRVGAELDATDTYSGTVGIDFRPLPFSGTGEISGELVYAGYGIVAPEADHNDYDGLNVHGKVALLLRGEPETEDTASPFYGQGSTHHAYFQVKAETAFHRGARGVIVVNPIGRPEAPTDFTIFSSFELDDTGSRNSVDTEAQVDESFIALLSSQALLGWAASQWGVDADRMVDEANRSIRPMDLLLEPLSVTASVGQTEPVTGLRARNVAAMVPGDDPERIIVVGGHHDHLGTLDTVASAPDDDTVFNGADDNASGVAAVLELARQLSSATLESSVYFVTFSSEEHGLLGSSAFASSQLPFLPKIDLMINLDMVGRNAPEPVIVYQSAVLPLGGSSLQAIAHDVGLPANVITSGAGGSDHIPFEQLGVPVVFVFSGFHEDYHGVDDEADRIDYDRLAANTAFVREVILAAAGE